jgi:hypothetical protein
MRDGSPPARLVKSTSTSAAKNPRHFAQSFASQALSISSTMRRISVSSAIFSALVCACISSSCSTTESCVRPIIFKSPVKFGSRFKVKSLKFVD